MNGVVIIHPEMGIYLGNCFGLGFFTNGDCGGQEEAALFATEAEARDYVRQWENNNDPEAYTYAPVTADTEPYWATIEELEAAGLGHLVEPLRAERLHNAPIAGRA